jgi:hypothetical protein
VQPGEILTAAMLTENPDGTVTVRGTETVGLGGGNAVNVGPFPYGVVFTARPSLKFAASALTDNTGVIVNWRSATDETNLYFRVTLAASATSASSTVVDWEATGTLA